jgi:hypothetical protein
LQTADVGRIQKIINTGDFSSAMSVFGGKNTINISEIAKLLIGGITTALDTICDVEDALPQLLSDVSDLTKEEVLDLPLDDFMNMAEELFRQPTFLSFFKRIQQSFSKINVKTVPMQELSALPLQK